ncbi:hypothetical protein F5Y19DRAFT_486170 [Xylariaceae sp. FL1651]|nr:hypothetical protein F5Y19DRAFT_486170 [Xylariaceae sp. FL1651]
MTIMDDKTAGQGLSESHLSVDEAPPPTEDVKPKRHLLNQVWDYLVPLVGLAWLAPIITLLVLNFQGYAAGAGVACGVIDCEITWGFNGTSQLDKTNHDVLGSLQLVAKALEVWFTFICGCLIYNLSMLFASGADGLPLRYLFTHVEFGDLLSLFSLSFWSTAFRPAATPRTDDEDAISTPVRKRRLIMCGFVLLVSAITVIANLMGPAVAVLLLPTLGWKDMPIPQSQAFQQMASSTPPANQDNTFGCKGADLASGKYSCSSSAMEIVVDTMIGNIATYHPSAGVFSAKEGFCTYSFNLTYTLADGSPVLAPSRQTMDILTDDYNDWFYSESRSLRNALQVQYRRQAPAVRSFVQCFGGVSVVTIADGKSIHCYDIPNPDIMQDQVGGVLPNSTYPYPFWFPADGGLPISSMCIRVGPGWTPAYPESSFSIAMSSSTENVLAVNAYGSDRAIYLNETTYGCLSDGADTQNGLCDWDSMFLETPPPEAKSTSINPLVVEYNQSDHSAFWCRSFAYLEFPFYLLNTSPDVNPDINVILEDDSGGNSDQEAINPDDRVISVHPDWLLAAWSVDKDGTIPYTRFAAQTASSLLPSDTSYAPFSRLHQVVLMNALSMIDYSMEPIGPATSNSTMNPVFYVSAQSYVWSYGLSSRTSRLGVAITILGSLIVLLYTFVGLKVRAVDRSLTNFVLVAMQQEPPGLLKGADEKGAGKMPVRIVSTDKGNPKPDEERWQYKFV